MADGGHATRLLVGAELVDDAVAADAGRPKTAKTAAQLVSPVWCPGEQAGRILDRVD